MSFVTVRDSVDTIRLKSKSCVSLVSTNPEPTITESSSVPNLHDLDLDELDQEYKNLIAECENNMRDLRADPQNLSKKQSFLRTKDKLKQMKDWTSKLNTQEGRRLLDEKKKDVEKRKYEIDQVLKMVKAQSAVDICFLVDCTSSMKKYIQTLKNDINQLTNTIMTFFKTTPYLAFIGYRDVDIKKDRLIQLDFTTDIHVFETFLSDVELRGGKDYCEDVISKKIFFSTFAF